MRTLPFLLLFFTFIFQILSCINLVSVSGQCLDDQRSKLLQLRESLQFNFTSSTKLVHWNSSTDCCSWNGVACDGSGHVINLEIDKETISNTTDNWKSLFTLQHLQRLNLAFNFFDGAKIPDELHNLRNLKYLNLSNAGFVGQIPFGMSRLKNLATLDFSERFPDFEKQLYLQNPDLKALIQNLTELRELYLDGVNISAPGNDWCNALSSLSNLRVLSLAFCNLSGPICSSLQNLSSLSVIQLDGNNLSTIVPEFVANFSNLAVLSVLSCNLHGQFPEKIFQVPTLQYLDFSFNSIFGSLPQFPKIGSLRTIILGQTMFSGSLPDSIGNLQYLTYIDMWDCNFSGPIPSSMAHLRELVYLDLSDNNFYGSIPSFHMSKQLAHIDLSSNALKGPCSFDEFKGLTNLAYINLAKNSLSGDIPSSLFALPSLQILMLSDNQFHGQLLEFPNASASSLQILELSSNHLEGLIPKSIWKLERLTVLSLSFNAFSGTIKLDMFKRLQSLKRLELSYNNLSIDATSGNPTLSPFPQFDVLKLASCSLRKFPDYLKNQSKIIQLDLSANQITGEIPNWIWNVGKGYLYDLNLSNNLLQDLQKPYSMSDYISILDLHSNRLQGNLLTPPISAIYVDYSRNSFNSIPEDIGNYLSHAYLFSISHNNITGVIPRSICKARILEVLDFSYNIFSGRVPSCLLKLEYLGLLILSQNKLSGTIPDGFVDNCSLQTLDLSGNVLEGKIPRSLGNCKFLQFLNMGDNNIEDTFPCILMKALDLHVIILRSNRFFGDLHCSWVKQNWLRLQIMDVAYNNFSGALPSELFLYWRGLMKEDGSQLLESKQLQFEFIVVDNLYYQDKVKLTIKGVEREIEKILTIYASIDFSCNKFHGKIPEAVGLLKALNILNFSHNAFTGTIPGSIGNLTQLNSLDLSTNQLSGTIPITLGSLTFLSLLNLSFNQLFGSIPIGYQLQTFSDTSFLGNTGLCGFPLNISCHEKEKELAEGHSSNKKEIDWEYICAGLGFAFGTGITCYLTLFGPSCSSLVDQVIVKILHEQVKRRVYRNPIRRLQDS